jgi:glucosamine--fructose-6-phosphate aminotransferase (isomerizing)
MKETTLLPSDAYPMLDFRHGPQSAVSDDMLLVALVSNRGSDQAWRLIADMHALDAATFVLCDRGGADLREHADYLLEFNTGWDDHGLGPLYMPAIHYLAYYRSLSAGLDPDAPPNLAYWIDTSG